MASILRNAMPRMIEIVSEQPAPFIACITQAGNVEVRYDAQGSTYRQKRRENQTR